MKLYSDAALAKILDKDIFHQISRVADRLGVECYVVGGYVRDIFLERPSDDIDVVVVGSGISVAKELKRELGRRAHLSVFKNFGTAQVKVKNEECGMLNVELSPMAMISEECGINSSLENSSSQRSEDRLPARPATDECGHHPCPDEADYPGRCLDHDPPSVLQKTLRIYRRTMNNR